MPIATISTDIQLQILFSPLDERGDVTQPVALPGHLRALTPLAAMELYEQLHAARNSVRRQHGLAEIATPDEGVLILAFLRLLRDEPAENLRGILARFDEAARTVQVNRLGEATAEDETEAFLAGKAPNHRLRCPSCKAHPWRDFVFTTEPNGRGIGKCPTCGAIHPHDEWQIEHSPNDHIIAEVPGTEHPVYGLKVRCPACKVVPSAAEFSVVEEPDGLYSTCRACGLAHLTYLWDSEGLWKPTPLGRVTAEATGGLTQADLQKALRPGWPAYPCPSCKAINDIRGWAFGEEGVRTATCGHCGAVHTEREWMAQVFVYDQTNGEVPAEVAQNGAVDLEPDARRVLGDMVREQKYTP